MWRVFKTFGQIAFAYSFFNVFFKIQDTIKSSPTEANTMKEALVVGIGTTTLFYMLCGCFGYAAFGDLAPENLLTGFGSHKPNWFTDIAHAALLIHLIGSYQVFSQPLFEFVEKIAAERFPDSIFIIVATEIKVPNSRISTLQSQPFCLVWGKFFVITTPVISIFLPFINKGLGIIGAIGLWVLTIYFPIEIYRAQKKIPRWKTKWLCFQILNFVSLSITIAAAAGSISGTVLHFKTYN